MNYTQSFFLLNLSFVLFALALSLAQLDILLRNAMIENETPMSPLEKGLRMNFSLASSPTIHKTSGVNKIDER